MQHQTFMGVLGLIVMGGVTLWLSRVPRRPRWERMDLRAVSDQDLSVRLGWRGEAWTDADVPYVEPTSDPKSAPRLVSASVSEAMPGDAAQRIASSWWASRL